MAFVPESVKQQLELCRVNGTLDFGGTGLADIPEQVLEADMPYVTKLDFSNNRLTELSPFITHLPALEVLDLTANSLLGLPSEVGLLSKLKVLRVGQNGVKVLPRTLGNLVGKLEELTFDESNISWPATTEVLSMGTDKLLKFLAAFNRAEKEGTLELNGWNFAEMPEDIFGEGSLHVLHMSHNKLTAVPDRIEVLKELSELWLDNNMLDDAFPAPLLALTTLTVLNLQGNTMRHLPPDLSPFAFLKELRVSDNVLQSIPPSVGSLRALSVLDVSFNQLAILPSEIGTCIGLRIIRARSNQLKTIPVDLTRLGQLEDLLLDGNPIIRLHPRVATMPLRQLTYDIEHLQSPPLAIASKGTEFTLHYLRLLRASETRGKLELENMSLDMVPSEACEVPKLHHLSVARNSIYLIPPHILLLEELESLDLSYNQIEAIPPFLTALTALRTLVVSHNQITVIPRALGKCHSLSALVVDGNRIVSPPPLILAMGTRSVMFYLQQLCDAEGTGVIHLPGLELTELPMELAELSRVTSVDVSRNKLTTVRPLNLLSRVTSLNMSQNRLKDVDSDLRDMLLLEELDLSKNRIVHLVSSVRNMTSLRRLIISNNPIQELPHGLWALNSLQELQVTGCEIRFPPQDVVAKGVKSLLNFQRMLERGRYTNRLDLSGVGFHELTVPDDMWADLVMLNVDRNYVSQLPAKLQESVRLLELRCASNQLTKLPTTLGCLECVQLLDVRNNVLQSLPDSLALLTSLTRLRASGNRLLKLPDSWQALANVIEVDADDNALISLPNSLFGLPKLAILRLSRNKIAQVPLALGGLTSLGVLTLNDNSLVRLPLSIRALTSLTEFSAANNSSIDLPPAIVVEQGIEPIRAFAQVVHNTLKTRHLDLSGFRLTDLPVFVGGMTGLTALTIARNQITSLEGVFPLLAGLTSLNALDNKLTSLPIRIGGLTNLRELVLDQSVWDVAAEDLLLTSSRHVREYLRKLLDAAEYGSLSLTGMGLRKLPQDYFGWSIWGYLSSMSDLNLSNNMLSSVDMDPVPAVLTRLELQGNHLEDLPIGMTCLTVLTYAGLGSNKFTVLPQCIKAWEKCQELVLADNKLTAMSVHVMGGLRDLRVCDVRNNQLTEIKAPIWFLPMVRNIDVRGNAISSPPMAVVRKGKGAVMSYFKALEVAAKTKKLSLNNTELTYVPNEVMTLKTVETLTLDGNLLNSLPAQIGGMIALQSLSAKGNQLASIPDTLSSLHALKTLLLDNNQLSGLPIPSMLLLTRLATLGLSSNQLVTPPFELFRSSTLTSITLASNPDLRSPPPKLTSDDARKADVIQFLRKEAMCIRSGRLKLSEQGAVTFPVEVLRVGDLTEIILSHNKIESLPPEIGQLTMMRKLNLEDNLLDDLPPEIGNCVALADLRLEENRLSELPKGVGSLTVLTYLDMSNNQLTTLPEELMGCVKLEHLGLRHNLITEVGDWISQLSALTLLNLTGNVIPALPFTIANLSKLKDLKVSKQDVQLPPPDVLNSGLGPMQEYLRRLNDSKRLKKADLDGIPMQSFSCHESFARFGLTSLSLRMCSMEVVSSNISLLVGLLLLDLSDNKLTVLPTTIAELTCLQELIIDRNMLGGLDASIGACTALKTLSLTDNLVSVLPSSLGHCTKITSLKVSGNPVHSPPDVLIRKRPLPWLLRYLRARHASLESQVLSLISMGLSDIPQDVLGMTEGVSKLLLNCNDLRDLPDRIEGMTALKSLSVANNKLMRLPTVVCGLPYLQALVLDDNMIKELPEVLNRLVHLMNLSAAHNTINRLPAVLTGLRQLRKLCLDGNPLGEIPASLLQVSGLEVLSMRDCGLAVVPDGLTVLRSLRELQVADNALEGLPEMEAMEELKIVRLSNNKLQQLPPTVVRLLGLEELSIAGNAVQKLPADFSRLTKLQLLQVDGENFDSVPQEVVVQGGGCVLEFVKRVGVAHSTQRLDLSNMGLRSVPHAVIHLTALQHLNLSDNPLTTVPSSMVRLANLKSLILERTKVRSLPVELPGLYELKELRVDASEMLFPPASVCAEGLQATFQYLRKISGANVVGTLDLSGTGMREVPVDISHAGGIAKLDLSNNQITRLPPELSLLSSLQSLELEGNPLRPHLQDIAARGLEAVMVYLRGLHIAMQTGKLDICGQGLRFYPDEVTPDWELTFMRLDRNMIRHVPRKACLLTTLTELSLRENALPDLPETMTTLYRLKTLALDGNQLQELPTAVSALTGLERLTLTSNDLARLPPSVSCLGALKSLAVEGNPRLAQLPVEIAELRALESLTFDSDTVFLPCPQFHTDFATVMGYLQQLHAARKSLRLDLSNRDLTSMPADVVLITGLTVLSLARNGIARLPDDMMEKLPKLVMLDVESNHLVALPESIGAARGLTCVCALGNRVTRIPSSLGMVRDHGMLLELDPDQVQVPPPEIYRRGINVTLGYLKLLEQARGTGALSLNKQELGALPVEVCELGSLTDLSVSSNRFTSLPAALKRCSQLTRLNVSNNMLEALPPELAALTDLTDLDCSGNPLTASCPSPDMLARGLPHVLAYFRRLLDCKQTGLLEVGALAHEALSLEATTVTSVTSLCVDTAPPYALAAFQFSASPEQVEGMAELLMRRCQLDQLPAFVPTLGTLTSVDLSHNSFRGVPLELCMALRELRALSLEHNMVTGVVAEVSMLSQLTLLNLGHNKLASIPDVIGETLTLLETLLLPNNAIQVVPGNLRGCKDTLKTLDLEHNAMTMLPPVCLELTRLVNLLLEGNKVSQLPLSLGKLIFLEQLTVPATDLGNVPQDVVLAGGKAIIKYLCGLEDCESSGLLDLSSMNLRLLPPAVRIVTSSLTILKLDDNPLVRLPTWLGEFQALQRISLRNTKVQRLPATLGAISSLSEVVVDASERLVSPPPEVVASGGHAILAYLRRSYSAVLHSQLDLSGFKLREFPFMALSTPTTLTSLSLNKNQLGAVPPQLAALSNLQLLSVSDNAITELPGRVMAALPLLKSLSVQGNKITVLPQELGSLRFLEYLQFDAEGIISPPRDVLVKSAQAVLRYLRKVWGGRCSGVLDLTDCDLTELPEEVTRWAAIEGEEVDEGGGVEGAGMEVEFTQGGGQLEAVAEDAEASGGEGGGARRAADEEAGVVADDEDEAPADGGGGAEEGQAAGAGTAEGGEEAPEGGEQGGERVHEGREAGGDETRAPSKAPDPDEAAGSDHRSSGEGQEAHERVPPHAAGAEGAGGGAGEGGGSDTVGAGEGGGHDIKSRPSTGVSEQMGSDEKENLLHMPLDTSTIGSLIDHFPPPPATPPLTGTPGSRGTPSGGRHTPGGRRRSSNKPKPPVSTGPVLGPGGGIEKAPEAQEDRAQMDMDGGMYVAVDDDDDGRDLGGGEAEDWTEGRMMPAEKTHEELEKSVVQQEEALSDDDDDDFEEEEVAGEEPSGGGEGGGHWSGFAELRPLEALDLRSNKIVSLREDVSRMRSLKLLQVCSNDIRVLPGVVTLLPRLRVVHATRNRLNELPLSFGMLQATLTTLRLEHNQLEALPEGIQTLSALRLLSVDDNKLTSFAVTLEDALPNLQVLSMGRNQIAEFSVSGPGALRTLRRLDMEDNAMKAWPEDLALCARLWEVRLGDNEIAAISPSIGKLRRLKELSMTNNLLQKLPPEIRLAKSLSRLVLLNNPLAESPACALEPDTTGLFAYLSALLDAVTTGKGRFAGHRMLEVPDQLLVSPNIVELDVSDNGIAQLPRNICRLNDLQLLNLRDNELSDVPVELGLCSSLHTLHIDGNRFKEFSTNICSMARLQVLTATRNQMKVLPCDLANMVGLVFLDVKDNEGMSEVATMMLKESVSRLMGYLREVQMGMVYGAVNLSRRGLNTFPVEVFIGCDRIETLHLAYNDITELPPTIGQMVALTTLDVSYNNLAALPEAIGALTRLTELHADSNSLTRLPDSFANLSKLETVTLEANPFESFPCNFMQGWGGLRELKLDTEHVVTLPDGAVHTSTELMPLEVMSLGLKKCLEYRQRLRACRATGSLDLSVMALWFMPASVLQMQMLTALNFTGNCLIALPDTLTALGSLASLSLNDNRLSHVPASIAELTRLKSLSLMDNRLQQIAPEIGHMTQLDVLNVTNNEGLDCPPQEIHRQGVKAILSFLRRVGRGTSHGQVELAGLQLETIMIPWPRLAPTLKALVLSRNALRVLPDEVGGLTALTALWVDNNQIATLPGAIAKLSTLKSLALDNNAISGLSPGVCELASLERLTLDNNQLRFLPPRLGDLQNLTLLSAANNRLTMLPASLASVASLRNVSLVGNPLAPLPPALRERQDIEMDIERQ